MTPHVCADCGSDVIYRIDDDTLKAIPDRCGSPDCANSDAASVSGEWWTEF